MNEKAFEDFLRRESERLKWFSIIVASISFGVGLCFGATLGKAAPIIALAFVLVGYFALTRFCRGNSA